MDKVISQQFFNQGLQALQSGKLNEAIVCFRRAAEKSPQDAEITASLGQALFWAGHLAEGVACLRQAGRLLLKMPKKQRNPDDLIALAGQLQSCNDFAGSLELLRHIIRFKHNDVRVFQLQAQACLRLNNPRQALTVTASGLRLYKDHPGLLLLKASAQTRLDKLDSARSVLQGLLNQSVRLDADSGMRVHRQMAEILDRTGKFQRVFEHLHQAASLSERLADMQAFDKQSLPDLIQKYRCGFAREFFLQLPECPTSSRPAPVFIVGLLRSGTTLVQQVLSTHTDVCLADENHFIAALKQQISVMSPAQSSIVDKLAALNSQQISELRQLYWDKVEAAFGRPVDASVFIDKTTLNVIELGIINCIFPEAKVLFVQRDLRDVALSCYMQTMEANAVTVHFSSWEGVLDVTRLLMSWWRHIKQEMTLEYMEISYQDLVLNFDECFDRVFAFLGLSREAGGAGFYKKANGQFIASPSYYQVARPLYSSSLQRWRHYRDEFPAGYGEELYGSHGLRGNRSGDALCR